MQKRQLRLMRIEFESEEFRFYCMELYLGAVALSIYLGQTYQLSDVSKGNAHFPQMLDFL